ncbi:MAG: aminoacyl-tRNA hydrolase [Bacteroidetes bacterium GWD2_45_23]|nr:MAG: aminoacyl-tRNA hydrolase [Bacteroidetes bacterium GWC2_46_850]OFX77481.1 MAG: aminoacyl-tRNA hydrolase [Bacteroidetes bacterium GWC1_47_7]OFX83501.1 MAG: aminoacyl-tRNA hydrolase [Bacteroidetes bacterium GWD2_45_23]HAR38020.1 aminoacyl-tRNA hydrolase [Porphyromonadaceae bacterium]HBB02133.1 aminoacyl-tRNA hydrolase [Porphyromonadaceae bacterium]
MKYLIAGLGNIGPDYAQTRHNIGFMVLDAFAKASNVVFEDRRYGFVAEMRLRNKSLLLLKPSTFMNLSGNAIRYWLQKEKIETENLLVVVDDLALPFGTLRLKSKGSDAGHNGLKHIQELIGQNYPRLRFGIGDDFPRGAQVNYVLDEFSDEEKQKLPERIETAADIIRSFCLAGINTTMNQYNNR